MSRRLLCAAPLLLLSVFAQAQDYPPPGTGLLTWERVADRGLGSPFIAFSPSDSVYAGGGYIDSLFVFDSALNDIPRGKWKPVRHPRLWIAAAMVLDALGDTLLASRAGGESYPVPPITALPGSTSADALPSVRVADPVTPAASSPCLPVTPTRGACSLAAKSSSVTTEARHGQKPSAPSRRNRAVPTSSARFPPGASSWPVRRGVAASDDGGASYAVTPLYGDYHYEIAGVTALATPGSAQSGTPSCGLADTALCDGAVAVGVDAAEGAPARLVDQ